MVTEDSQRDIFDVFRGVNKYLITVDSEQRQILGKFKGHCKVWISLE